ncbi:MAG: PEP-CTERM sorting domain-containing protein [Opitutaceae bacterium]
MKNTQIKSFALGITALSFASIANAVTIADIGLDYTSAPGYVADTTAPTAAPDGWSYLRSDAATGGTENALTAQTGIGNGGNSGFAGNSGFNLAAVLGGVAGGAEYEIFSDGFEGGATSNGNQGLVGTDLLLHPGDDAGNEFVIARYTISLADIASGTSATISGSFRNLTGRDDRSGPAESVTADIFHNGTSIFGVTGGTSGDFGTQSRLFQADGTFNIAGLTVAAGDTISFVVGNNGGQAGDETALQGTIAVPEPSSYALLAGCIALGAVAVRRRK